MPENYDIDMIMMEAEMEEMDHEETRLRSIGKLIGRYGTITRALPIIPLTIYATYAVFTDSFSFAEFPVTAKATLIVSAAVVLLLTIVIDGRMHDLQDDKSIILARKRVHESLPVSAETFPRENENASTEDTYFDHLVKINVENLAAYYELVKIQTDKSFRASLTIAYFGAILIIIGLCLGFYRSDLADKVAYIATGAGVLTEFISGVFFWLYSRTVSQLRGYHDSLISVQNILLSFKLVSDTRDPKERAQMVSKMCSHLLTGLPKTIAGTTDSMAASVGRPGAAAKTSLDRNSAE